MTRLLILSFTEEQKASSALRKLNELEKAGNIIVYEKTMVRKKADGDYEILKEENTEGWKTITGMALGGLVGLLGGPIGLVIGLYAGTTIGAYSQMGHYESSEAFLTGVEANMPPGTVSIFAEVDEKSSYFIDTTMPDMGAVITWSDTDVNYIKYFGEQIEEINQQIVDTKSALNNAGAAEKIEIEKRLSVLYELRKKKVASMEVEKSNLPEIIVSAGTV